MSISMLFYIFLMSGNGINADNFKIYYHNIAQSVNVLRRGEMTHVNFGDVVGIGGESQIAYVGNSFWRRKDDPESKIWDKETYSYNANDICNFEQFVKTGIQVLDDQFKENEESLGLWNFPPVVDSSYGECTIDFNRASQHETINRDGTTIPVNAFGIVKKNGESMAYVGNTQWIAQNFDGSWNFKCLMTLFPNDLLNVKQFKVMGYKLKREEVRQFEKGEWKQNGYCDSSKQILKTRTAPVSKAALSGTERQLSDMKGKLQITSKYNNSWIVIGAIWLIVLCCVSLGCNVWYIKQKDAHDSDTIIINYNSETDQEV